MTDEKPKWTPEERYRAILEDTARELEATPVVDGARLAATLRHWLADPTDFDQYADMAAAFRSFGDDDHDDDHDDDADASPVDFLARRAKLHEEVVQEVKGEVGTITGPPIVGTDDTVNAGPPVVATEEDEPLPWLYDSRGRMPEEFVRRLRDDARPEDGE